MDRDGPPPTAVVPERKTRLAPWLTGGIFTVWGGVVLFSYLIHFPPSAKSFFAMLAPHQYLAGSFAAAAVVNGLNLLVGLFFVLACAGLGRFLLSAFKAPTTNLCEEITFSAALGLVVFAQATLALAVAGLLYRLAVVFLLVVSAGLGAWSLKSNPRTALPEGAPFKPSAADFLTLLLLGVALLLGLAGALSPEIFYDSLVYQLAVPNYYVIRHELADMPFNCYSNLFLLHGMLYSAGLLLTDEFVPKFLNYAAVALSALALLGLCMRHLSIRAGLVAALIYCSIPQTQFAAWSAGSETLLTFFGLTAFAAILRYEPGAAFWLLLSAVLAGAAMGVKATGLFAVAGIALVLVYRLRGNPGAAGRALLAFGLAASLPVLPWLAKNAIYRHNPVFPFLTSVFGVPENMGLQRVMSFLADSRQMAALELRAWLAHPWMITMGEALNSQFFTPLFLFLLPLVFLLGPAAPTAQAGWIYFLTVWLLWSSSSTIVRYLMPAYPAAGLVIAAALEGRTLPVLKRWVFVAVLLAAALGLYWAGWVYYSQGLWRPLTGVTTKQAYLAKTQPVYAYSPYAAIEFINNRLPARAKTLFVGEARSYYLRKDFVSSSVYDKTPLVEWAMTAKSGDALFTKLRAEGITHLLLNASEAIRLGQSYRIFYWDDRAREVFNDFWNHHLTEVSSQDETKDGRLLNRVAVYELVFERRSGTLPPLNLMEEVVRKNIEAATTDSSAKR